MTDPSGMMKGGRASPSDVNPPRIDDNDADIGSMPMYANDPADGHPHDGEPALGADPLGGNPLGGSPLGGGAGGDADALAALQADLARLREALGAAEAKAADSHEQLLRASAEAENVRRRAREDVTKAHKFAVESFAESMLPVRDSLEMALSVQVPTIESLRTGVEATLRQLNQAFERNKLLVIDPLHQKFDPNHHQAISMVPSTEVPANHVVSVLQKGYLIHDRILRPALVTVSQGG